MAQELLITDYIFVKAQPHTDRIYFSRGDFNPIWLHVCESLLLPFPVKLQTCFLHTYWTFVCTDKHWALRFWVSAAAIIEIMQDVVILVVIISGYWQECCRIPYLPLKVFYFFHTSLHYSALQNWCKGNWNFKRRKTEGDVKMCCSCCSSQTCVCCEISRDLLASDRLNERCVNLRWLDCNGYVL